MATLTVEQDGVNITVTLTHDNGETEINKYEADSEEQAKEAVKLACIKVLDFI